MSAGPFDTAREVRAAIGYNPRTDPYPGEAANELALLEACANAGVQLGEYDRVIVNWLSRWEPETCGVVAGIVLRAAGQV